MILLFVSSYAFILLCNMYNVLNDKTTLDY